MNYTVLYFARYRELLGTGEEVVTGEFASVDALREFLILRGDREVLAEKGLMCARNQEMCGLAEPLFDGDEVAFFPTVTGG
ncbi:MULTISPECIES: MoaD/ThiS family protein [Pseudomonas]|uniref:MoaD/ThiS family protein n=1 Tax=Pseudomonas baltica TaxID=2762576 RepID=A0A7X1KTI0_9PSED|nr:MULTISPECIES: MoaD/ThiS family protein [Pseudomonas]MBC2678587.1 MoaD/ThiS family protein [Pseudomonas baltica]MBD8592557.1 MoaD/ThiS family protein [Pseudomonas sp. CFBP 8758]MBD8602471.1 MoaD/ThiS family protein [Pseudomonas sp. CFBP 8771]MBD8622700.1 MoaD/ThiS family protein [Pseudomonas sp. CFBP 13727]MBD8828766.1 MoaD/ThiS family protein [Pseudomonas sp. CFBP 13602]